MAATKFNIITSQAARKLGMTPAHAEDIADCHDAAARDAGLKGRHLDVLRHEVIEFRLRRLAQSLRAA